MPVRPTPLSVATPELLVAAVAAAAPLRVNERFLPLNPEPPEVSVAVSVAVLPEAPEPLTELIAVETLLGLGTVLGLVVVAVVTSNASTQTQDPLEDTFFLPATSTSRV